MPLRAKSAKIKLSKTLQREGSVNVTQNPGCVSVNLCNDLSGDYFPNIEQKDAICLK